LHNLFYPLLKLIPLLQNAIFYFDLNFVKKIYATKVNKNNIKNTIYYRDFISTIIIMELKKRKKEFFI